jgi:hypothetical protein
MAQRIENGADFRGPLLAGGSAGASGQVLTSGGAGAVPTWSPAGGFTGGTLTSNLTVAAGTTSLSPLMFQSGTNLTSATAGAMEYDGKVIYSTPNSRGVSPSIMFYRLNGSLAGANVTTAQSLLGVGVTLAASTVYAFEGHFVIQKTAGTTSHNISLLIGGTATLNNINYLATTQRVNTASTSDVGSNTIVTVIGFNTTNGAATYSSSINSAAVTFMVIMRGTVSINASGTFIPQYQLSTAPGGAYSTLAGSDFYIWPIGAAGANTSVGAWA